MSFTHRQILTAIIAVSIASRLASALYQGTGIEAMPGVTDQISYHELAIRVVDGHGFSFATGWWPATRANQPTAHWSFLYVLFVAAIYAVVGPLPIVVRIVQALIVGVLHPLLMWRIGSRLFGAAAGLAAAAVAAIYGYFVFYGGSIVTESLYMLAFLWAIDLATLIALARDRQARLGSWVLLGVAIGSAAVLRQVFLLVVPVIVGWVAWQLRFRREPMRFAALAGRVAIAAGVSLLIVLPWTARNYRAFGELVLLNTNAGFVFYWGNHPVHGSNFVPILSYGSTNYGTMLPRDVGRLNEAQLDRELLRRGLGFVKADPVRYARLSVSRVKEYFKFWPTADSGVASNAIRVASFGLFLPFFVLGAVQAFGRPEPGARSGAALLIAVAAVYTLVHLLTWTLVRYRLPVDGILMPFAGVALAPIVARVFAPSHRFQLSLSRSTN